MTGPVVVVLVASIVLSGCGLTFIQKRNFDFKTTALFKRPCDENLPPGEFEVALNRCNSHRLLRMIENFMSIQEADDKKGQPGDSLADVRGKGFNIYLDEQTLVRRPNTRVLYGAEALAAVGMAVSPPPLQNPSDVKVYAEFMSQHYAEEYLERDMAYAADRFCLNNRESLEIGEDRTFTILWRDGHVYKRIIKGGPVNNPKQERAILVCPGTFIIDLLTGQMSNAAKSFSPVK
jgi:hypothetical protein